MVLDSSIKFPISLPEYAKKYLRHSRTLTVFPSYFSKFTGISRARFLRTFLTNSLSISFAPAEFSPVSPSNSIV